MERFIAAANAENLEAYVVAEVTQSPRMVMRWGGEVIADLSRAFLSSNGADKHTAVTVPPVQRAGAGVAQDLRGLAAELNLGLQRGLGERFDASIGAGSVLMPFGGRTQTTPTQAMAALLPVGPGRETDLCSVMAWGFRPKWMESDPFTGASVSVVDSLCRLVAAGCDAKGAYLSFQEYFEKLRDNPVRWGKPFSALLGTPCPPTGPGCGRHRRLRLHVRLFPGAGRPPTLISFAIARSGPAMCSPEFKEAGHPVYLFRPEDFRDYGALSALWVKFHGLCLDGTVKAAWAVGPGGAAEAVMKMSFGNRIGFLVDPRLVSDPFWDPTPGAIVAECGREIPGALLLGYTSASPSSP